MRQSTQKKENKGYMPLAFLHDDYYFYKNGAIYIKKSGYFEKIVDLYPASWKDINRATVRLFRREPKCAAVIDTSYILISSQKKLFLIDINAKKVCFTMNVREQFSEPLNMCAASDKWIALWGDYGSNSAHREVYIYGLTKEMVVEKVYKFEAGTIRHIHNIVPKKNGGYYVFTGDWGDYSGIYESDSDFKTVIPKWVGQQKYRAVVGFDTDKGLLFATDAVNEKNYIYLLREEEPTSVCSINGSCIYGTSFHNGFLFSTTVEPDESNRGILSWISQKRGTGILSDEVHLIYVDSNLNCKVLAKYKKDIFPMKLFQYGKIMFPAVIQEDNLLIYPVAVKKYDGTALWIETDGS
ncbi:MAG: hypothetical protein NC433_07795 [Clostridiales bacterium]|nr:hypothetical protein [Clostridiales bacterium]